MFGVLGGSEGKVGLAPAKASLLQAAGGLAASAVSGAGVTVLAVSATGHFVIFLETETETETHKGQVRRLQAAPDSATVQHPSSVCHLMTGIYVYSPLNLSYFFLDCTIYCPGILLKEDIKSRGARRIHIFIL